jgi:hypothetical protein
MILETEHTRERGWAGRTAAPVYVWPSYAIDVMIDGNQVGLEPNEWESPELRAFIKRMCDEGKL